MIPANFGRGFHSALADCNGEGSSAGFYIKSALVISLITYLFDAAKVFTGSYLGDS